MSYFPDPPTRSRVEVSLNLENYATKDDLKGATGIDTTVFTKNVEFNKVKQDVQKLKNSPHTTDEDTKKELASIKSRFNNFATTYTSDKKEIEDDIKARASKTDLSTEKTNLVSLIDAKADKSTTTSLFNEHKTLLTRLTSNQNSIKEYVKDKANIADKFKTLEVEVEANKVTAALASAANKTNLDNVKVEIVANKASVDMELGGWNTKVSNLEK